MIRSQQRRIEDAASLDFLKSIKDVSLKAERELCFSLRALQDLPETERSSALNALQAQLAEQQRKFANRKDNLPELSYPAELPVSAKRADIVHAIRDHQVVIIAGETGSGKTTQIPKMCLEAGFGLKGMIGHTQPRRIAARAVAQRLASELHQSLGQSVGYKVRFTDSTSDTTAVKLMTDGILLAETASDRLLLDYDCIIIDEAHERSLNIDFLLGYIKRILKKRPDLHLIITSATIDPERFSRHFDNAPIIEVSGRTYPVEVVYMPLFEQADDDENEEREREELDLFHGVLRAFNYLMAKGRGDVLVFLPGERDIMDLARFLRRCNLRDTEILPLYARLAQSEQNKIFTEHTGVRIVLATNVAETSLTVPGIRYVIDPGMARISRYSARTKVQRLPVEPISQASANQRKGRCGRVMSGICVRLYSEEDFNNRPLYTDPEILRTNLAAVILQMTALHLGSVETFPFIDPPNPRQVSDGLRLLEELGAIRYQGKGRDTANADLTAIGRKLSRLPIDPRLGRMILEGARLSALNEVLIIAAALALIDPRERPLDKKDAAEQFHQRFNDEKSDFISMLKLYEYVSSLQKTLSNSALRRQLKHEFISYLRVREWFDLHRQLKAACQGLQLEGNQLPADYEALHRSLLSGLLSQIGQQELSGHEYKGARGVKFLIFPGSALAKKSPKWLCAAALVETSRLFARTVAAIDPCWLEWQGAHLIKKSYADPHWSKKSGAVLASLTISLYGLAVVQGRQVQYGTVDPALCHELMIKEGLVGGEINCRHAFYQHNQHLIAQVEHLEDQVRRRDLLAEPEDLERFYQERIPGHIINQRQLDKWWQEQRKKDPHYLDFKLEDVLKQEAAADHAVLYPEYWQQGSLKLKLSYVFNPGDPKDGVSVHIPLTVINQVKADDFVYQIPGLRLEFLSVLIRSLPKRLRRNLIPAPDYARALLQSLQLFKGNLYQQAARELTRMGGEIVSPEDFDLSSIDRHLFISFIIEDLQGKELACGKNLGVLAQSLAGQARSALQQIVKSHQSSKAPVSAWTFGEIKKERITKQGSLSINAYPALTDKGSGVALELYDSKERQARAMWLGQRRLIFLNLKNPLSFLEAHLPNKAKLAMYYQPLGSVQELVNDMMLHAINELMVRHGAPVWNEIDFRQLFDKVRANLHDAVLETAQIVEQILREAHELKRRLKGRIGLEEARAYADVGAQLDALVYKGFVSACSKEHLGDIPRYLQAALLRLDKLSREVNRDLNCLRKLEKVSDCWQGALTRYPKDDAPQPLLDVKWMIEELRVSYFAQTLGVKGPISDKRILQEINRVLADYPPLH